MTTKHTPGPWIGAGPSFGDPLPRYTTEIITESEDENGEVRSICELPVVHHDDENEANARLIAAAPDLLEVLKHIRRCIPYGGFVQIHDNSMTLAQIDAAIAKAEGGAETIRARS